jgi:hypothetical protein
VCSSDLDEEIGRRIALRDRVPAAAPGTVTSGLSFFGRPRQAIWRLQDGPLWQKLMTFNPGDPT